MKTPESIPSPRILAYHAWAFLSVLFYRTTRPWQGRWPVCPVQWWLVGKQYAAYPPEHRYTIGGQPK